MQEFSLNISAKTVFLSKPQPFSWLYSFPSVRVNERSTKDVAR